MARYQIEDKVQSLVTAQKLHLGHIYTVKGIHETRTMFGYFVAYDLEDSAGNMINGIQNGHLILNLIKKVKPKAKNPSCSVCIIETGNMVELQRKGDRYECPECGSLF